MTGSPPVALVNMPFSASKYPSIQLHVLQALARRVRAAEPDAVF